MSQTHVPHTHSRMKPDKKFCPIRVKLVPEFLNGSSDIGRKLKILELTCAWISEIQNIICIFIANIYSFKNYSNGIIL